MQWHIETRRGFPATRKRKAPQAHPPVCSGWAFGVLSVSMLPSRLNVAMPSGCVNCRGVEHATCHLVSGLN
jgi:hypothetical protein